MLRGLVIALALILSLPAWAEPIVLKRGLSTEPWTSWPDDAGWSEPGFLDVFPEWRKAAGPQQIAAIKAAGFDFVRLAIDPAPFLWQREPRRTAALTGNLKSRIREFEAAGLNVVVDIHAVPKGGYRKLGTGEYLADDAAFERYLPVVKDIGLAIADEDPAHVAFEPFNEPTIDCDAIDAGSPGRWPQMLSKLHRTARAAAPRLTLVIQGACWGGVSGLTALDPRALADANIIWCFHSYEPFLLTHQGASWTDGPERYISGLRYPPSLHTAAERKKLFTDARKRIAKSERSRREKRRLTDEVREALNVYFAGGRAEAMIGAPFDKITAWAQQHGIPPERVLLGEFGVIRKDEAAITPTASRTGVLKAVRRAAEAHGFAWAVWSWSGSFALTGGDAADALEPQLLSALGLAKEQSKQFIETPPQQP